MDDLECQLLPADSINEAAKVIVLAFLIRQLTTSFSKATSFLLRRIDVGVKHSLEEWMFLLEETYLSFNVADRPYSGE
jgi:hypothetical protein